VFQFTGIAIEVDGLARGLRAPRRHTSNGGERREDHACFNAVRRCWPQVTARANWSTYPAEPYIYRCELHLRKNALTAAAKGYYDTGRDSPIRRGLETAFHSPQDWAIFVAMAKKYPYLARWCRRVNDQLISQTAWRAQLPAHHSNAEVERAIATARNVIDTRAFVLRNKFRTNQMLELVRVRFNHQANQMVYARTLRAALGSGRCARQPTNASRRGHQSEQAATARHSCHWSGDTAGFATSLTPTRSLAPLCYLRS
jgi:hypothetical protein